MSAFCILGFPFLAHARRSNNELFLTRNDVSRKAVAALPSTRGGSYLPWPDSGQ